MPPEPSDRSAAAEASYVVRGDVSPEAIADSLRALLSTRPQPLPRRRVTLLDTFDWRVRRTGGRLTRRGATGASTLAWQPKRGETHVTARLQQPVGFAWDLPDGPLQQGLTPVIGVRRLLPMVEAEAHGWVLDVLDERGKTVARLRIESGRARRPRSRDGWQPLPTVITLTGMRGYEAVYHRLVPVIESRPGVEASADGLHEAALRHVEDAGAGAALSRVTIEPTVRADVGARRIQQALLRILVLNEPGVRADLDTEFLHDFRVAVRRTRALLRQIRDVLPPDAVEHFSAEFAWIGRLTGSARDLDVLVLGLRQQEGRLSPADLAALTALLEDARREEHRRLVEALDSERYQRLLADWAAFLESPAADAPEARRAARALVDVVSRRAWRLSRRLAASAGGVDANTDPARLHEVRIEAKKLRYLVDVSPSFYEAADLEPILAALKALQRVLGDFNDACVQEGRLVAIGRAAGAERGDAGALLALGRLAEQRRQRADALRTQVVDALQRFRDPALTAACRRAFKRPEAAGPSR